ncbi:MAG: VWA domain-containing protein, partial [Parcubacteria group bacterium]
TYVSSSLTPEETTADYIKWNVGTLQPGDSQSIDLTMLVSESADCGSTLINKAKYWSTQTDWGDFVIEETSVTCQQECILEGESGAVVPAGPSCCEGLTQIGCSAPVLGGCSDCVGAFYCTMCGNGICGSGENECNCPQDCKASTTINAYKIVCQTEDDLPNWGTEPGGANITENTAENYVAASQDRCQLAAGWDFQWGFDGQAQNQDGDFIGYATSGWKNFDTQTTATQPAQVQISDFEGKNKLWFREVQKEGYFPFSSLPESQKQNNVSAEFYCNNDVLNYDNYEWIESPMLGETYYCVGFNAPSETQCILEGESGAVVPDGPSCCEGLTQIGCDAPVLGECSEECTGAFYCTMCGNGICGAGENKCNCPEDCEEEPVCEDIIVVSNIDDVVVETSENAVLAWIHSLWTSITGSDWIWKSEYIENPTQDETYTFSKDFNVIGTVSSATLTLATDNSYKGWINNVSFGENTGEHNYEATVSYDVTDKIQNGTNTIQFEVTNMGLPASTPQTNPAGLLYNLRIERSSCEPTNVSIYGIVFEDLNENKVRDAGEPGIKNVLITLDGTTTDTTDINGAYSFLIATAGPHTVVETDTPGYYSTTPNTVSTSTSLGESYEINFGDAMTPYCGDGNINQTSEKCDDGNTVNGDGCSATCQIEQVCNPEEELVINGGFENPTSTSPQLWDIFDNASMSGWQTEWMAIHPSYQDLPQPLSAYLELQRGVNGWLPFEGNQYAELDADWDGPSGLISGEPASVKIHQDISTIIGNNYAVSFYFSPRPGTADTNNKLEFSWGGITQPLISAVGTSQTSWTKYTYNFTATSSTTSIQFADLGTSDSLGTFLDDVSVRCKPIAGPVCGNETLETGEQCDDGNTVNGDGCSATCQIEPTDVLIHGTVFKDLNGNGAKDTGDSGIQNVLVTLDGTATSTTNASGSYSFLVSTEGLHTVVETDNPGYYSTTPNTISTSTAFGGSYEINFGDAMTPYCGDGEKNQTSEQCDDGNTTSGDGCSATCQTEYTPCLNCYGSFSCGDGTKNGNEECDGKDGVTEGYICTSSCVLKKQTLCSMDLNAMIIMDVSGSMGYENPSRLTMAKTAANNFLGYLRSSDKSGVVSFSSTAALKKGLSSDHGASKAMVNSFTSYGSTNIGDAVDVANKELMSAGTSTSLAKIEILLTDGRANKPNGNGFNENPADVALALSRSLEAAEKGIRIFTIGLGDDVNSAMLQSVADNTNGKYYFSPSAGDLNEIFNQIASEVCKTGTTTATSATPAISIFNTRALLVSGNKVTVSWYTNIPATSRVVYGSNRVLTPGQEPNYGYAFSTPEQDSANKVIFHSVTITGLVPGTTYFWRPISHGSPVTVGQEASFTTSIESTESATSIADLVKIQAACKQEGESVPVIESPPACCSELELIPPKEEATLGSMGICTKKCGDGTCDSETESSYNCSEDCKEPDAIGSTDGQNEKGGFDLKNLVAAIGIFGNNPWWNLLIPLAILAFLYWIILKRKENRI